MTALGIDIGGSGIKGAVVDTNAGNLISERVRIPTPESNSPEDVLDTVVEVVSRLEGDGALQSAAERPVGIGFPAVVQEGAPRTPFTAQHVPGWIGFPVAARLQERLGGPVTLLNDADAAGIAEMRFGAGRGQKGVVVVLTLGTGIGSALFTDGQLAPNTEFGRFYLQGHSEEAEQYAAADVRKREGLKWEAYAARLDAYLNELHKLFWPDLIIVGGGVSKKAQKFIPRLTVKTQVVPAALRNRAGIIGAATAATARQKDG